MDNIILYDIDDIDVGNMSEGVETRDCIWRNQLEEDILNSMKILTMNEIAINKKRVTVQLDFRGDHETSCAICLFDMHRQAVKHIPCGHTFHLSCLNKLLNSNLSYCNKCPCCRKKILNNKTRARTGSEISNYYLYYYGDNSTIQIPVTVSRDVIDGDSDSDNYDEMINNLMENIMRNALVYINQLRESENNEIEVNVFDSVLRSESDSVLRSESDSVLRSESDSVLGSESDSVLRSESDSVLGSETDSEG